VAHFLIHLTHGPEHPTQAALGFLVARAAVDEGHDVSMFLAGDAVQLVRAPVLDGLVGLGTGELRESFDAVVDGGGRLYLSGMSSKARGVGEAELEGSAQFATPHDLLKLSLEADRVLTY
jgi:predicted peroxiredoxin